MKRNGLIAILAVSVIGLVVNNVMSQQEEDHEDPRVRQVRESASQNNFSASVTAWNQFKQSFANAAKAGVVVEPSANERELLKALDVCVAEGKLRNIERQLTSLVNDHPDTAYAVKARMALKALNLDSPK